MLTTKAKYLKVAIVAIMFTLSLFFVLLCDNHAVASEQVTKYPTVQTYQLSESEGFAYMKEFIDHAMKSFGGIA